MANRPFFVHVRPKNFQTNPKGGFTIAIDGSQETGYQFATARCHERDNFNKHVGRAKAAGRLRSITQAQQLPDNITNIKDAVDFLRPQYQAVVDGVAL